ncbi:DEAD/H (Asp-Glu-Ala-Asp/His) box polypeptide 32a [Erpetoichthys calabaricus]|uniref:DEAD/H (Asp-Glu-Ala-Asp/His) box polypeptide 32a n=1 Tax=Erpetoichthys calabaricus TaxID=27687 RepID=UPI0022343976|nr:DEAD/H (Asp-Glu-Ala-Asp/His) box polypeptide 32a [Erpetoichthys calabaricus]
MAEAETPVAPDEQQLFMEGFDSDTEVDTEELHFGDELELNQFDGLPHSSRYYKLLAQRRTLAVWNVKDEFMESLRKSRIVILAGTANSGKSSQIPQWCAEYCLSAGFQHGTVVCTQVHRQNAVGLALRVADEMDVNIGHEVGYTVPLESCCTSETVLRYCTDDLLLREIMSDPLLEQYGVIIIDQAHERTVSTDILLGLLKDIGQQRPELRLVVIAASHMSSKLLTYFGEVPCINVNKKTQAEVVYGNNPPGDYFYRAVSLVFEIHSAKEEGDIVVFFASMQEANSAYDIVMQEAVNMSSNLGQLVPITLIPRQGIFLFRQTEEQEKKNATYLRRIFLTSSMGEDLIWATDNVKFVIDAGVETKNVYNTRIRANSLVTRPISKQQFEMRQQLASSPGKCFCLYPEDAKLSEQTPPEILETKFTSTVLLLKRMNIAGLGHCDFLDRPDPESLMQALEELDYLAALDDDGNLSEIGIIMSELPLDPQLAKALLASCEFDCVNEMLTIAAMLTAPSCFLQAPVGAEHEAHASHSKFHHPEGDHFTLINVYNAYKQNQYTNPEKWCADAFLCCFALQTADAIRSELTDILRRIELPISEPSFGTKGNTLNIKRALLSGYFMQIARDVDGSGNYFMLTHKHIAQLHPSSGYGSCAERLGHPEWVLFHEYTLSENNCIRTVSEISPEMFVQIAPQYFFCNLPTSESKELLQKILDELHCERDVQNTTALGINTAEDEQENQPSDRCTIQ